MINTEQEKGDRGKGTATELEPAGPTLFRGAAATRAIGPSSPIPSISPEQAWRERGS